MVAALAAARVAEALVVEKMAAKEAAGQGRLKASAVRGEGQRATETGELLASSAPP